MTLSSTLSVLLTSTLSLSVLAHYQLAQDYTGINFFDNFDFYNGPDPSNGHVHYVGEVSANRTSLAGFQYYTNATKPAQVVHLGVDAHTKYSITEGRPSTRVESIQTFNRSLVIADILHMPSNECGVWPAFWMLGTSGTWPMSGEIDIIEGVNDANFNSMTLHSTAGVSVTKNGTAMKGNMTTSNCDVAAPGQAPNVGCAVQDTPSSASFGKTFNSNQGGVFAMQYTSQAIKIWFFNRTHIPDDIDAGKPSPPMTNGSDFHAWGIPNAVFQFPSANDSSSSDTRNHTALTDHFYNMQLIFNTNFCGDWAGKVWNSSATCSKLAPTCEQYVSENPEAFKEVYWSIKSLQVFVDEDGKRDNTTLPDLNGSKVSNSADTSTMKKRTSALSSHLPPKVPSARLHYVRDKSGAEMNNPLNQESSHIGSDAVTTSGSRIVSLWNKLSGLVRGTNEPVKRDPAPFIGDSFIAHIEQELKSVAAAKTSLSASAPPPPAGATEVDGVVFATGSPTKGVVPTVTPQVGQSGGFAYIY